MRWRVRSHPIDPRAGGRIEVNPLDVILLAGGWIGGTGILAIGLVRAPRLATLVAVVGALLGGGVGLGGALWALRSGSVTTMTAPWGIPGGALVVGIDPLSAFF
jgi:hypothetical protein